MQELVEELGIYMLFFGRAGYGDNDAHPKRGLKSDTPRTSRSSPTRCSSGTGSTW
jgi:hypothetical protein